MIYEHIERGEREALHGRIAAFLQARQSFGHPVAIEEIAHHYLRSDDREKAAEHAIAASEKLHMTFAFQRARDLLESAIAFVDSKVNDRGRR